MEDAGLSISAATTWVAAVQPDAEALGMHYQRGVFVDQGSGAKQPVRLEEPGYFEAASSCCSYFQVHARLTLNSSN